MEIGERKVVYESTMIWKESRIENIFTLTFCKIHLVSMIYYDFIANYLGKRRY